LVFLNYLLSDLNSFVGTYLAYLGSLRRTYLMCFFIVVNSMKYMYTLEYEIVGMSHVICCAEYANEYAAPIASHCSMHVFLSFVWWRNKPLVVCELASTWLTKRDSIRARLSFAYP